MPIDVWTQHLFAVWPIIGMGIFVMILWVVLRPTINDDHKRHARIPLDNEDRQDG